MPGHFQKQEPAMAFYFHQDEAFELSWSLGCSLWDQCARYCANETPLGCSLSPKLQAWHLTFHSKGSCKSLIALPGIYAKQRIWKSCGEELLCAHRHVLQTNGKNCCVHMDVSSKQKGRVAACTQTCPPNKPEELLCAHGRVLRTKKQIADNWNRKNTRCFTAGRTFLKSIFETQSSWLHLLFHSFKHWLHQKEGVLSYHHWQWPGKGSCSI